MANAARLQALRALVLGALTVWLVARYGLRRHGASTWGDLLFSVCSGSTGLLCLLALNRHAASGGDLAARGMIQYYFDLIYLNAFSQVGGVLTRYAWLVLLAVPAFVGYKLWTLVLAPYVFTPREGEEGDAGGAGGNRKQRREQAKQARRGKPSRA